jgi:[ribosomal protein S18]-alanine N-acetyltransferase
MIDYSDLPVRIEPMRVEDIGAVLEIERQSFSAPWSARAYDYELRYNDLAHYFVARLQQPPSLRGGPRNWLDSFLHPRPASESSVIVGYVGFWLMAGEAHISTIAVTPRYRGRSLGELILVAALERAMELHAQEATLEVRVSNLPAQELYLKYGFAKVGARKGYYTDNNEDALIMTTPLLGSAEYQQRFQRLKEALLLQLRAAPRLEARRSREKIRGGSVYGG